VECYPVVQTLRVDVQLCGSYVLVAHLASFLIGLAMKLIMFTSEYFHSYRSWPGALFGVTSIAKMVTVVFFQDIKRVSSHCSLFLSIIDITVVVLLLRF
jgi:hypothetical protein